MENTYSEAQVTIQSEYPLSGTITIPGDGRYPAILFIPGSGPVDRDENHKQLRINAFKELSDVISPLGFVTLRYDKRGVGQSSGQYLETGLWDLVNDVIHCIEFLKDHPNVDPDSIILVGHSEGALLAPAVYRKMPVQGIIFLAGGAESLKDTVAWQNESLKESLSTLKGFQGFLIRLLNVPGKIDKTSRSTNETIMNSTESVLKIKHRKVNAKWYREHFTYNVAEDLPEISCPILAITGTKDVQVRPEHAKVIAELVKGPSEYHVIDEMTHILRKDPSNTSFHTILKGYRHAVQQPVDSDLVSIIKDWLMQYFSNRNTMGES